jgi:hypothetical protein
MAKSKCHRTLRIDLLFFYPLVIGMPKTDMVAKRQLVVRRYEHATAILGISSLHSFEFFSNDVCKAGKCSGAPKSPVLQSTISSNFNVIDRTSLRVTDEEFLVNNCVAVHFEDDWYPGCIQGKSGRDLMITFMTRKPKAFNQQDTPLGLWS